MKNETDIALEARSDAARKYLTILNYILNYEDYDRIVRSLERLATMMSDDIINTINK